jgi:predicted DNA-binding transcriptional regulator AlpA
MWEDGGRWYGRLEGPEPAAAASSTREDCLAELRRIAGADLLTVREIPSLVGVAEAASILGWDKRRIFTYLSRGSFPQPVAALASGRVWLRSDIEAYSRSWRKRRVREKPR